MTAAEIRNEIECFVLEELVGDMGMPCDNHDYPWCPKGGAEWAAHMVCPACIRSGVKLWCTGCKDFLTATEDALECAQCGEVAAPARRAVARLEPINKRGAA